MSTIIDHSQADFIFIQDVAGVYIIKKNAKGLLEENIAVTEYDVLSVLQSKYRTIVANVKGEVLAMNFNPKELIVEKEEKKLDMTLAHQLLLEVEQSFLNKEQILDSIDKALADGNKKEFMRLTGLLKEVL